MDWAGLLAPARTPPAVLATLNAVVRQAMDTQEVRSRIAQLGGGAGPVIPRRLRTLHHRRTRQVDGGGARIEHLSRLIEGCRCAVPVGPRTRRHQAVIAFACDIAPRSPAS
ncbi:hypothetical protein GXW71_10220 [Roseomonas hellenica]|uniref:Transposase n=1 Tax=Plastoroseomonas hellenica TaxID=2687306 RepID=A0ABS5EWQ3_9PROT|nr:hypothetical protein [Plastoroseomonas hellenica]